MTARPGWHARNGALPASFEGLFRAEYARVVRVAERVLGDRAAAEDVAQEAFLSFYRAHEPSVPYAASWLHTAAAHGALNVIRSTKRRAAREASVSARQGELEDGPEAGVIDDETRDEIRQALARMPARAATLLALRYSGLSYAECAAALGIGANQIGTLLRRAEQAFKKELTSHG